MSKESLSEFFERKNVRYTLAAICLLFTIQGSYLLLTGQTRTDFLRGGGEVLLWGAWAIVNILKPSGRTIPGLNAAMNIGLVLIVASWIYK